MPGTLTRFLVFIVGFGLLPLTITAAVAQQSNSSKDSLPKFAGSWEGKCQDGRTFVVLALRVIENQVAGTVSIGNMHGDDEGACMLVTAPPVPEHAQKISNAVAHDEILSFNGSKRPDGSFARFEVTESGPDKAELKLLDTPVEKHPWRLVKSKQSE